MSSMEDRIARGDWRLLLNIYTICATLGIELLPGKGHWRDAHCPFPDHPDSHPSFRIAVEPYQGAKGTSMPGHWFCHGCNRRGNIEQLYVQMKGGTPKEARRILIEQFAPDYLLERKKGGSRSGPQPLPTDPQLATWRTMLANNKEAMDYLLGRTLTKEVIADAKLGWEAERIKFPVFTREGKLVNCKTHAFLAKHRDAGEPKMKLLAGNVSVPYPMWMLSDTKRRVVVEGEIDALSLHSIGERGAVTTIKGANSVTWANLSYAIPTGKGSAVYICLDNDREGVKAAIKFATECTANGVEHVYMVPLPENVKDINQLLMSLPTTDARVGMWESLLIGASKYTTTPSMTGGLVATNGAYFSEAGNKVAPFTGFVTHSGIVRLNTDDEAPERIFHCKLRHEKSGELIVKHRQRSKFLDSIMETKGAGPSWMFHPRDQDAVLTAVCGNSGLAEERDAGHLFGFGPTPQRDTYYSPSTVFDAAGPRPNADFDPLPPTDFLAKFDLPLPVREKFFESAKLIIEHFLHAHKIGVMLPILATSLFAAVRRREWPSEPRYTLAMYGASGCGKTSRAILGQLMFSSIVNQNEIMSFESTLRFIESSVSLAGDVAMLVDEVPFLRARSAEVQAIERLLQSVSQGTSRGRLSRNGQINAVATPAAILIITTEALPTEDEAMLARMLPIRVGNDLLASPRMNDHLRETLRHAPLLRQFMSSWIAWVMSGEINSARLEMDQFSGDAERQFDTRFPDWRTRLNGNRILSRVRTLTEVVVALSKFLRNMGVVGGAFSSRVLEQWREEALPLMAVEASRSTETTGVVVSMVDQAAARLMSGGFCLSMVGNEEGRRWPLIATPHAVSIGLLKRGHDPVTSIVWGGEHWSISLGAAMAERNTKKWGMLVQQMIQKGLAIEPKKGQPIWLSSEGASMLIDRLHLNPP